jgi:hypothetical protein
MFLVVTSSTDPDLSLFKSLPRTAIVVPAHLSQPGWFYEVSKGEHARLVASTGVLFAHDISGVLTRIKRVWPGELPHINEEDREYVASEMTAFLAALLNELPCVVVNRPAANCLLGPPWTAEHWKRTAADAGFLRFSCSAPDSVAYMAAYGKYRCGRSWIATWSALSSSIEQPSRGRRDPVGRIKK